MATTRGVNPTPKFQENFKAVFLGEKGVHVGSKYYSTDLERVGKGLGAIKMLFSDKEKFKGVEVLRAVDEYLDSLSDGVSADDPAALARAKKKLNDLGINERTFTDFHQRVTSFGRELSRKLHTNSSVEGYNDRLLQKLAKIGALVRPQAPPREIPGLASSPSPAPVVNAEPAPVVEEVAPVVVPPSPPRPAPKDQLVALFGTKSDLSAQGVLTKLQEQNETVNSLAGEVTRLQGELKTAGDASRVSEGNVKQDLKKLEDFAKSLPVSSRVSPEFESHIQRSVRGHHEERFVNLPFEIGAKERALTQSYQAIQNPKLTKEELVRHLKTIRELKTDLALLKKEFESIRLNKQIEKKGSLIRSQIAEIKQLVDKGESLEALQKKLQELTVTLADLKSLCDEAGDLTSSLEAIKTNSRALLQAVEAYQDEKSREGFFSRESQDSKLYREQILKKLGGVSTQGAEAEQALFSAINRLLPGSALDSFLKDIKEHEEKLLITNTSDRTVQALTGALSQEPGKTVSLLLNDYSLLLATQEARRQKETQKQEKEEALEDAKEAVAELEKRRSAIATYFSILLNVLDPNPQAEHYALAKAYAEEAMKDDLFGTFAQKIGGELRKHLPFLNDLSPEQSEELNGKINQFGLSALGNR